jgi:hypothetical protein
MKLEKDKPEVFTFGLWLREHDYITLRSILALAGDLIQVLEKIITLPNVFELGQILSPLLKQAEKFRDARDFFIHMDEALRDHSIHGISGPICLICCVEFSGNATNNVYLIWEKIHYSSVLIKSQEQLL